MNYRMPFQFSVLNKTFGFIYLIQAWEDISIVIRSKLLMKNEFVSHAIKPIEFQLIHRKQLVIHNTI